MLHIHKIPIKCCQTLKLYAIERGKELRADWAWPLNDRLSATAEWLLSASTKQSV